MSRSPLETNNKKDSLRILSSHHNHYIAQHGKPAHEDAVLLRIPSESLTHITSFLDPPGLFALARTSRRLHEHVNDDNTWRRAYVYQFLGIAPESDLRDESDGKRLMLRREESSWKREFVRRYNLRRRWKRSRNQTITHIPHHSVVSCMHMMPSSTILSASLKYGIVSRSYALTGKVLRGFFDASGAVNGLGIGNPNQEFSPHVSAVALASEGGTAKVFWGFRHGEVAVTTAHRAMDGSRASEAKHARCRVDEGHEGTVNDVAWGVTADGPSAFMTGAADGRVKVWDTKRLRCLWTSDKGPQLVTDPCVKVAIDVAHGVAVGGFQSGDIVVWTGFSPLLAEEVNAQQFSPCEFRMSAPATTAGGNAQHKLAELGLAIPTSAGISLLVAYLESPSFYRLSINLTTGEIERTAFGDGSTGPISVLKPVFATQDGESSFVLAGDHLGCISVFSWDAHPVLGAAGVSPVHKFEAHEDGVVTALAWNAVILVSGSSRGTVKVWDSLTFASLRAFASPAPRPAVGGEWDGVSQILLESDVVVASIGTKVIAWKAGPVGKHGTAHKKGKQARTAKNAGVAKRHQQLEMYRDIAESRRDLDKEQSYIRRAFRREREQRSTLDGLGLNEVEAVEYVLMLSRDEEERRRQAALLESTSAVPTADEDLDEEQSYTRRAFGREREQRSTLDGLGLNEVEAVKYVLMLSRDEEERRRQAALLESTSAVPTADEGVFLADFDDPPTPVSGHDMLRSSEGSSAAPSVSSSISTRSYSSGSSHLSNDRSRLTASSSNHKIQVSPRLRPEPMEAGFGTSPIGSSMQGRIPPPASDSEHFPSMSRTSSSAGTSVPSTPGTSSSWAVISASPASARSAWSTPLRSTSGAVSPAYGSLTSSPPVFLQRSTPPSRAGSGPSPLAAGFAQRTSGAGMGDGPGQRVSAYYENLDREEEDLRFAIELSLAEARSRAEDV